MLGAVRDLLRGRSGAFEEYRFYPKNLELVLVNTRVIACSPARLLVADMGEVLATLVEARTCAEVLQHAVHWPWQRSAIEP